MLVQLKTQSHRKLRYYHDKAPRGITKTNKTRQTRLCRPICKKINANCTWQKYKWQIIRSGFSYGCTSKYYLDLIGDEKVEHRQDPFFRSGFEWKTEISSWVESSFFESAIRVRENLMYYLDLPILLIKGKKTKIL